jgi:hypothetical protein
MRGVLTERLAVDTHPLADGRGEPPAQSIVHRKHMGAVGALDLVVFVGAVETGIRGKPQDVGLLLELVGLDGDADRVEPPLGGLIRRVGLEASRLRGRDRKP